MRFSPLPAAADAEMDTANLPAAAEVDVHIGIVHGIQAIRFVAAAATRSALMEQLAEYVGRWAARQLAEPDAAEVARRLLGGETAAAVELYFTAGKRWDDEWLMIEEVLLASAATPPNGSARST